MQKKIVPSSSEGAVGSSGTAARNSWVISPTNSNPEYWSREATRTIFTVFGQTQPGIELTSYTLLQGHSAGCRLVQSTAVMVEKQNGVH